MLFYKFHIHELKNILYLYDNKQLNIHKCNIFIHRMGTLQNIGIKLFVFAALEER
jgi:hypothetical protein